MLCVAVRLARSAGARSWPALVLPIALGVFFVSACPCVSGADNTFVVNSTADDGSQGTLRWAINQANAAGAGTQTISIQLSGNQTIALGSALPMLDNSLATIAIQNAGEQMVTIDGQDTHRAFFVASGTVSISNLAIINGAAQGGNGGAGWTGGGGGLGAGGAIFVNTGAHVTIENVQFDGNQATGGNGGAPDNSLSAGGGGGGFGGDGAAGSYGAGGGGGFAGSGGASSSSGGGGGGGIAAGGGQANAGGGGGGGTTAGNSAITVTGGNGNAGATGGAVGSGGGNGAPGESPTLQGAGGGGAGGNSRSSASGSGGAGGNGGVGGGGGGGGRAGITQNLPLQGNGGVGGNGGTYGGGGGGGYGQTGGNGGDGGDFGGGGGGGNSATTTNTTRGGNGGFGGGGGGAAASDNPNAAKGGFGAGDGGVRDLDDLGGGGNGGSGLGGAIFVRDGGTLTVIGATVSNSSVTAGNLGGTGGSAGSTAGSDLYLMSGVTATFDQAGSSFSGSIAGAGGVTVKGMGTTVLSGESTYTGATNILDQSRLLVNGAINSDTTVDSDATLGGTGTISGAVTNSGNVAPGNSIGRLIVDGAYTQNAGSTLTIEINAAGTNPGVNNDLLLVDSATLNGGIVSVEAEAGTYTAGTKYHFFESLAPINGAFDGITGKVGGLGLELGYDFDGFFYWSYFTLISLSPDYWQYAVTPNEKAVADYLDLIYDNPDPALQDVFDGLNTLTGDPAAMQKAFNAMSDQVSPTTAMIGLQNTTLVVQQLAGQLRTGSFLSGGGYAATSPAPAVASKSPFVLVSYDKRSARPVVTFVSNQDHDAWQGWSFGYGLGGSAQSDGNAAGLTYGMGGMLLGAERYFDRAGRIGFYGGYQGTGLRLDGLAQSTRINGGSFGSYLYNDDGFNYYTAITGLQFNGYDTTRYIQFDGINETASGNFSGWQGYGYLERGVSFRRANVTLQPYAALQYIYLRQNNYTETGAGVLNLAVSGIDANSLRSLVGGRVQYDGGWYGGRLVPELRALWLHEFLNTEAAVNSYFAPIGGSSFATQGLNLGRDWAILGGGLRYELASGWTLYGNYDAQVNAQQVFHVGSGGLTYAW